MATDSLQSLVSTSLVTAEPGSWRAWRPGLPPPHMHGHHCAVTQVRIPGLQDQRVCVMDRTQMISRALRTYGRWYECDELVKLWHEAAADAAGDASRGVFLEVGGNIGACTVEMLLRTNATPVVFEPSPVNLHYLTTSLAWMHDDGKLRHGALVLPVGLGNETSQLTLHEQRGNSGTTLHLAHSQCPSHAARPPSHDAH